MPKEIHSKGDPHSQIWCVCDEPYQKDAEKGFLFSSGLGYVFDKMMKEAGITDYYVTCRKPDLEDKSSYRIIENDLNHYKPPLIIALGNTSSYLCKEIRDANTRKGRRSAREIAGLLIENEDETPLDKYAGSLLCSNLLTYPHYVIPSYLPDSIMADWSLRDIIVSLDLGKAKSELDYYKQNGFIQPLPDRKLLYDLSFFEEKAREKLPDFSSKTMKKLLWISTLEVCLVVIFSLTLTMLFHLIYQTQSWLIGVLGILWCLLIWVRLKS